MAAKSPVSESGATPCESGATPCASPSTSLTASPRLAGEAGTLARRLNRRNAPASSVQTESVHELLNARTRTHRQHVWLFLHCNLKGEGQVCAKWAKRFQRFTAVLILLNIIADVLDSEPLFPFSEDRSPSFRALERFTCIVFTVEYILRVWSCVDSSLFRGNWVTARLRYMSRTMPAIDLVVIIVFYCDISLTSYGTHGLHVLRVIRMLRLLALLKMERQMPAIQSCWQVFVRRKHDLYAAMFVAMILLLIASSAMYYVENEAQPTKFKSIPATMWWSVTAMTTVGYGDIYPTTVSGKFLGSVVAFLGVGLFALPSGIVSSGFIEVLEERRMAETEELAEMLEEDKASIDTLHRQVEDLGKMIIHMQGLLQCSMESQQQVLSRLNQLGLDMQASRGGTVKSGCHEVRGQDVALPG